VREVVTNISGDSIFVIRDNAHNDTYATRPISFIEYFGYLCGVFIFPRSFFDSTLDILVGHICFARLFDGFREPRILMGIFPSPLDGESDEFRMNRKYFSFLDASLHFLCCYDGSSSHSMIEKG
jgi:hypothetical protein